MSGAIGPPGREGIDGVDPGEQVVMAWRTSRRQWLVDRRTRVSTVGQVDESGRPESPQCSDDDAAPGQYRHSFDRDCQSGLGPIGDPLLVTRTSPTTWVVGPTGNAQVFSITTKGRTQVTDFGSFSLPFRMTLEAK
jgi:hypothetical protein